MPEQNRIDNKNLQSRTKADHSSVDLDPGLKSLSAALRSTFVALKIIMVVLVIVFLAWGFRTVRPDEPALVLRFGKIRGLGENRLLGPGLHWVFPYPIDEMIKIPVEKKVTLNINSFWYYQTKEELLGQGPKNRTRIRPALDPIRDGYCITRGEKRNINTGSAGSDYNIVHCKWQLIYKIDDPEKFYRNVYVRDAKPGEIYFDVITESITPLLQDLVDDAVVAAMVNYTIDEALLSEHRIPKHVERLLQQKLDTIQSGIKVISVNLAKNGIRWPRQVDLAFLASIKASQTSQKLISEAKTYAENTLNEAGGPVAEQLLATLKDKAASSEQKELLWSQLAGAARAKIAQAKAYRTKVVETARANAQYLLKILPEYHKYPRLVVQKIYQDAIEDVFNNIGEKIIIQPTKGTRGSEIRVLLNRDPSIKHKTKKEQNK